MNLLISVFLLHQTVDLCVPVILSGGFGDRSVLPSGVVYQFLQDILSTMVLESTCKQQVGNFNLYYRGKRKRKILRKSIFYKAIYIFTCTCTPYMYVPVRLCTCTDHYFAIIYRVRYFDNIANNRPNSIPNRMLDT